jgi:hypothetical protein
LMDSNITSVVAALTKKRQNISFTPYFLLMSIKLLSLEQMTMWHGYCLISWLKLLKAAMVNFGTYPCLLVLHPVLEALVPCCHHFESCFWGLLSHVTHLFLKSFLCCL